MEKESEEEESLSFKLISQFHPIFQQRTLFLCDICGNKMEEENLLAKCSEDEGVIFVDKIICQSCYQKYYKAYSISKMLKMNLLIKNLFQKQIHILLDEQILNLSQQFNLFTFLNNALMPTQLAFETKKLKDFLKENLQLSL